MARGPEKPGKWPKLGCGGTCVLKTLLPASLGPDVAAASPEMGVSAGITSAGIAATATSGDGCSPAAAARVDYACLCHNLAKLTNCYAS